MKIVAAGPLWRGSNAGGLFFALSRLGCLIEVLDEFYFIALQAKNNYNRVLSRVLRPIQEKEFNEAIKEQVTILKPDMLLIYKGAFVKPETLLYARQHKCKLVLFYPDVSTTSHGPNIPRSIPLYDLIFTTKTFAVHDLAEQYNAKNVYVIPHGFDPGLHRKLEITNDDLAIFGCDVSFIGAWSPKKEQYLQYLKETHPEINLKIWGGAWTNANSNILKSSIQYKSITGDLYAMAIQCSKINLGILSEKITGASSGDLITSRTFHIPGASGFMLHERNKESLHYFEENKEAGFFDGPEEMAHQVSFFLEHDTLRKQIAETGHLRALKDHSLDNRARELITEFTRFFK